jgi:hypothetical protein
MPKEYRRIDRSLDSYALRPGAPWGFVVFRTVYGADSDAGWDRMLEHLRSTVPISLSHAGQLDLLPRYELTIVEDAKALAGGDAHTVRHDFRAWVAEDLTPRLRDPIVEGYGGTAQVRSKILSNDKFDQKHPLNVVPPRWNFCFFVDEACLRSLSPGVLYPSVKIVTADWQWDRVTQVAEGWEDGETDHEFEEVGWMYMDLEGHMGMYDYLVLEKDWELFYERPYVGFVERKFNEGLVERRETEDV